MTQPSPSGPFWCWQTADSAETLPSYLNTAMRSPPEVTTRARFSGISATPPTRT